MRTKILTLVSVILAFSVQAQNPSETLTLEQAMQQVFDTNPSLMALEYEKKAAKREKQAAIGLFMPKISVRGAYTYLGDDIAIDLNGAKSGVQSYSQNMLMGILQNPQLAALLQPMLPGIQQGLGGLMAKDWSYTIQDRSLGFIGGDVVLPLCMGGKIIAANKAAKLNEQSVLQQEVSQRNSLTSELVERYYGYALALDAVEVRRKVVEGMEHHLNEVQKLEANGMVSHTDYLYVEYKLAEARRELMNAELKAKSVASALSATLGCEVCGRPASTMFVLEQIEPLEYFREMAEMKNPLLEQVEIKRQLARQNIALRRSEFFPEIVAMGGGTFYNYQVSDIIPRWAVGVGFTFKIFDGLNREYRYSAARNTVRRVEALQSKAHKDIGILVDNLYNTMLNYQNCLNSVEHSIAFAEDYLRAKQRACSEGIGSSTDVIDAELNLAKVRIERMEAAYNFDVALAKLLEAVGESERFIPLSRSVAARQITFNKQ